VIKDLVCGFVIGVANIIPGVSGGTFALILGLYDRLLGLLNKVGPALIKELYVETLCSIKSRSLKGILHLLREKDLFFLARILIGSLSGILLLSALMKYLLINQFEPTYGYFFGLILVSILFPLRLIKNFRGFVIPALILGAVLTIGVAAAVNPVEKTLKKSVLLQKEYLQSQESSGAETKAQGRFSFNGKYTLSEYAVVFVSGALAISAMVLPGVSGSLVLILLGQYFMVVSAISGLRHFLFDDLLFLIIMGLGIVIGLLSFARLLEWALKRYYDPMMGFLTGLVAGSLYALWPFKSYIIEDIWEKGSAGIELSKNLRVYSNQNILPESGVSLWVSLIAIGLGIVTMLFFLKHDSGAQKH
jgi:putative membrane protein